MHRDKRLRCLFSGWQKHVTCLLTRRGVALYISLSTGIVAGFLFSLCTFNLFIFSCRRILFDYYRSAIYSSALRNKVCKVFFFFFSFFFFAPTLRFSRHDPLLKCEGNVLLHPIPL